MKRALITGSAGFVGQYLQEELREHGYDVTGLDLRKAEHTIQGNLLDLEETRQIVRTVQPDVVIHLAGQSDVAASWKIPQKTMEFNVIGTMNLMEAVRTNDSSVRMVLAGSSDQYGNLGAAGASVGEETPMQPQTPYAVSKMAQEEIARVYVRTYGMNLCMTRSFNHGGAGQREGFLISDFSAGIARIEKGMQETLNVGNLTASRDFTHVKDIVRAYRLIAEKGLRGEVYNVGSGQTYRAQEILERLIAMASCPVKVEQDPAKMRPSDTPVICCDHSKLTAHTGWEPEYGIEDILSDSLQSWRTRV